MRIKPLFGIPDGEKVTEKALRRVLISSICSILLCMTCLVSATWAWFTVSIENTENVIEIAAVSETVTVTNTNANENVDPDNGVYNLENGKYSIRVQLTSNATGPDDLNKKRTPVYGILSVTYAGAENDAAHFYFPFADGEGEAEQTLEIYCAPAALRFSVTWVKPAAATPIGDEAVIIGQKPTELTEMPTTEPTTMPEEATEISEETTAPPATEAPTDPVETSVPPTTEPTTIPEEPNTSAATEPSTVPSETMAPPESE